MAEKSRPQRPSTKRPAKPPPKERTHTTSEPKHMPDKPSADSVFEVGRIRKLVELMKEHDLSEVDLRESRQRIRICRGPKESPRPAYGPPPPPPPSMPPASGSGHQPPGTSTSPAPAEA